MAVVAGAGWLRMNWPADDLVPFLEIAGIYAVLFVALALVLGINASFIRAEWEILRGLIKK